MSDLEAGRELDAREREHLSHLLDQMRERRTVDHDSGLRNAADWRDVLFCAASNLESGAPQAQPTVAGALRSLADELVRLSLAVSDGATMKHAIQFAVLPVVERREDVVLRVMLNRIVAGATP